MAHRNAFPWLTGMLFRFSLKNQKKIKKYIFSLSLPTYCNTTRETNNVHATISPNTNKEVKKKNGLHKWLRNTCLRTTHTVKGTYDENGLLLSEEQEDKTKNLFFTFEVAKMTHFVTCSNNIKRKKSFCNYRNMFPYRTGIGFRY